MDYRNYVQDELKKFEKKFNIKIEDLHWVESLLSDVYEHGYDSNEDHNYRNGYDDGYEKGYKEGYDESEWENQD